MYLQFRPLFSAVFSRVSFVMVFSHGDGFVLGWFGDKSTVWLCFSMPIAAPNPQSPAKQHLLHSFLFLFFFQLLRENRPKTHAKNDQNSQAKAPSTLSALIFLPTFQSLTFVPFFNLTSIPFTHVSSLSKRVLPTSTGRAGASLALSAASCATSSAAAAVWPPGGPGSAAQSATKRFETPRTSLEVVCSEGFWLFFWYLFLVDFKSD